MAPKRVLITFLCLAAVRAMQPPQRTYSPRAAAPLLGRRAAAAAAAAAAAPLLLAPPPEPVLAAAPCVDGALRWKKYREGSGPKPPDGCVEVPYAETDEFKALSTDAVNRRAEAAAARKEEDERTREAFFRTSGVASSGGRGMNTVPSTD